MKKKREDGCVCVWFLLYSRTECFYTRRRVGDVKEKEWDKGKEERKREREHEEFKYKEGGGAMKPFFC